MAVRVSFSPEDFEKELIRAGLTKTVFASKTTCIWLTPNGKAVTVPMLPEYGEWLLDDILIKANLLYRPWDQ